MRLFHLITSLGGGGTENFLHQLLKGSPAQHTHDVFYLGHDGVIGERIRSLGIRVTRVTPWSFHRMLVNERPDVLHTCLYWAHQVGRLVGRLAGVPSIVSSQRSIDAWQKPWHRWSDEWTLRFSHAVIVNSESARLLMTNRLKGLTTPPRVELLYNGLNASLFQSIDRAEARRALGVPDGAIIGGTLMRLHAEKGADRIPAFAKSLLSSVPNLHLLIAGRGPLEKVLKEQTRSLGPRLRWMGWKDESIQFLSALDFFWLLSREESFPQALLEASGAGLPWLAPDVGGIGELTTQGAAGLVFSPNQTDVAVSSARQVMSAMESWTSRARTAAPSLLQKYDLDQMTRTFYTILESRGPER